MEIPVAHYKYQCVLSLPGKNMSPPCLTPELPQQNQGGAPHLGPFRDIVFEVLKIVAKESEANL
eukprot:7247913-Ditylum_brightwellii.AAC.1